MMTMASLAASFVVAALWVPLLVKFFRSWRERGNPISLSICATIILAAYAPIWLRLGPSQPWLWAGLTIANLLICGFFYVSLMQSRRLFKDSRRRGKRGKTENRHAKIGK